MVIFEAEAKLTCLLKKRAPWTSLHFLAIINISLKNHIISNKNRSRLLANVLRAKHLNTILTLLWF